MTKTAAPGQTLELDVCRGDGRFPLRNILQHDRPELCRARPNRVHTVGIESIENGFLLNRRLDRTCDFVDDFLWGACGSNYSIPGFRPETRVTGFGDCRYVRKFS